MNQEIIEQLDIAEKRNLTMHDPTDYPAIKLDKHKAVLNLSTGKVASIVSPQYEVIQHRDVAKAFMEATDGLNLNAKVNLRQANNKATLDFTFPEIKKSIEKVGEEFTIGFRLINSYNKTTGVEIKAFMVRMACMNGMVVQVATGAPSFKYRHNQVMAQDFAAYIEKAIHHIISKDNKFAQYVSEAMEDSTEWKLAQKLIEGLIWSDKHRDRIKDILARSLNGREPTRWDIYNAITDYATHGQNIKPNVEARLQEKAEQTLVQNTESLLTQFPVLEVEAK